MGTLYSNRTDAKQTRRDAARNDFLVHARQAFSIHGHCLLGRNLGISCQMFRWYLKKNGAISPHQISPFQISHVPNQPPPLPPVLRVGLSLDMARGWLGLHSHKSPRFFSWPQYGHLSPPTPQFEDYKNVRNEEANGTTPPPLPCAPPMCNIDDGTPGPCVICPTSDVVVSTLQTSRPSGSLMQCEVLPVPPRVGGGRGRKGQKQHFFPQKCHSHLVKNDFPWLLG